MISTFVATFIIVTMHGCYRMIDLATKVEKGGTAKQDIVQIPDQAKHAFQLSQGQVLNTGCFLDHYQFKRSWKQIRIGANL